jgi:4-oxalocrotonate tautomerase
MPFIHVEMIEGRSREQKEALVKEVTEVVSKHTGAPTEHIYIIIQEIKAENLGQNGKLRG